MWFSAAFLAAVAAIPIIGTHAGQVPVVDGVVGGVPLLATTPTSSERPAGSAVTPGSLRIVENSGVCETTAGVYQASGYGDIASDKSMWFWFFASRDGNANAPVALWFNGGPGSSSMIGLVQEHGPCRIKNDSSTVANNPYSWNSNAHVLYIDQPIGVGFSTGTLAVSTSQQAAADVWTFLQIFFKDSRFSKYQPNNLALWTESYGGHYGPTFAAYILSQNTAIDNGSVSGVKLNLKILGIGNGLTDPLSQYPGYISYASSNPYHALVSSSTINSANTAWSKTGGCKSQITSCNSGGSNSVCSAAQSYCNNNILSPLAGPYDVYDVRTTSQSYPPDFTTWINSVRTTIGASKSWTESNSQVYSNFASTGDWMRNSRPNLETVINAGIRTLIFDGDADYICNYQGVELMVNALQTQFSSQYATLPWTTYTVKGQATGQYKQVGTFAYLRVFGAGHEVPAYTYGSLAIGQAALQFFNQITSNQALAST